MTKKPFVEQVARGHIKLTGDRITAAVHALAEILIVLLDRSGSMAASCGRVSRLEAAQQASVALVDARTELGADDQVGVIGFNDHAHLFLPLTQVAGNRETIDRAIRSIVVFGGTDFGPALNLAQGMLLESGQPHIVLLSDGRASYPARPVEALKEHGAVIETVGVGFARTDVDEEVLKRIASVVDGKVLYRFIQDGDDLVQYFRSEIACRLVKRTS